MDPHTIFRCTVFDSNLESCLLFYESHNDTLQVSSLLSIDSSWSHIDPHEIFSFTVFDSDLESNLLFYESHNDTLQVSSLLSIDSFWRSSWHCIVFTFTIVGVYINTYSDSVVTFGGVTISLVDQIVDHLQQSQ